MDSELFQELQRYFNSISSPNADEQRLRDALNAESREEGLRRFPNRRTIARQQMVWRILVEQIVKGNVIPVIGNEMVKIQGRLSSKYLLECVAAENYDDLSEPVASFTTLMEYEKEEPQIVYELVAHYIREHADQFVPTDVLREFLSIEYFPFVLTTTVDPMVENAMREIYGDKLRVLAFSNDAQKNEDIESSYDISRPTLYYMFGKANDSGNPFVLTDTDLLRFSRSWLLKKDSNDRSKPANLANALAGKYLLVLGNGFQDWLFRFFWFAMKDEKLMEPTTVPNGMDASEEGDRQQVEFLNSSHINTFQMPDLYTFVKDLKKRLDEARPKKSEDSWFDRPAQHADVFISYSRADSKVAELLYELLVKEGLTVWFDKKNLGLGDEFKGEIRNAIRSCKIFIPVFSDNITRQAHREHIYRLEWSWAVEHLRLVGKLYYRIVPLAESGFDFYNERADIPEAIRTTEIIKSRNAGFYAQTNPEIDLEHFARGICELKAKMPEESE